MKTTGLHAVKILEISITSDPKERILEFLQKYIEKEQETGDRGQGKPIKPLIIVTPNPEQIVLAQKNSHFRDILNQADVAISDGIGIVWAGKILGQGTGDRGQGIQIKRIAGVELMEQLVAMAEKRGVTIGLIGGRGDLAVRAFECLQKKHPRLAGWGTDAPEMELHEDGSMKHEAGSMNNNRLKRRIDCSDNPTSYFILHTSNEKAYFRQLAKKITETRAQMVFVGLGAPKQEYVIKALLETWDRRQETRDMKKDNSNQHVPCPVSRVPLILMSVGGAFDEISGRLRRSPAWMDRIGFKWLWRLIQEPWRWRRQLALLEFIWLVGKEWASDKMKHEAGSMKYEL